MARTSHHTPATGTPPRARPFGGSTTFTDKLPFTDAAKVAVAKTATLKAAKKAAAPVASTKKPAAAAKKKGGLAGLLSGFGAAMKRNTGHNEELARQRMIKAARKG